ncbi:hypothetical protein CJU90_4204 [Yarrowia sp. C11]|nr:hypothetical protein CJU90_4204 [Yarrowia sp. C11]
MTTFYLGYSKKSISSNSSSVISSVYNSSDEFQDAERAWDPTDHLVHVVTRRAESKTATPALSRTGSSNAVATTKVNVADRAPPRARGPSLIALPCNNTFMAHGLPTCDDLETVKEFDFVAKPTPLSPYTHISVPLNSPLSRSESPCTHGVVNTSMPVALEEMLQSSFPSHYSSHELSQDEDDSEMAAFLDDEDDYPASCEEDGEEEAEEDAFFVCAQTIKDAHESVLDLRALLEDNFSLVPGESVESLEKRALRMVHLEESFSVQDSFEPRTLLADQNRAFIPWKPVIEDLETYFEMRYPDLLKGSTRYEFHRARLVRNRTRLRILAKYVADLEEKSRNLCRLSRSF